MQNKILSGFGVFETMRAYQHKIVYFSAHLERIKKACKLINLKFPSSLAGLKKDIQEAVKINGFPDAYVRLTLYKSEQGTDSSVIVKKYRPPLAQKYRTGFSAAISCFRQDENSFLSRIKSTSRLLYEVSLEQAKAKGFDEAILLNQRGYISEGTRSNIFFVRDKEIFTPALECGCLDGITRRVILDLAKTYHLKVYQGNFTPQDLTAAEEAFLTNSLMGVMPLTFLEKKAIGKNKCGSITKFFIGKYRCLLK